MDGVDVSNRLIDDIMSTSYLQRTHLVNSRFRLGSTRKLFNLRTLTED